MLEPLQGPRLRPLLRLGRHVRAVEKFIEAHGGRLGDISIYGQESNHTTWRLAKMNLAIRGIDAQILGTRRHLPPRPAPRPEGRLHPRQPAVQRQRLGRRAAEGRPALEVRRAARGQRQLRLGAAHHPPPGAHRHRPASCWPTARCPRTSRARARSARPSSRPTWWTAWSRCRASSSTRRRSRPASGSSPATRSQRPLPRPPRRGAVHRRAQARHAWSTAPTAS